MLYTNELVSWDGVSDLLDDVDKVKAEFNTALGMVRSGVRQATDAVVAVSEQLYPHTVILLIDTDQTQNHSNCETEDINWIPRNETRVIKNTLRIFDIVQQQNLDGS